MAYLHHPQFPMNGTELECDGEELRPDGMCAKCERVNERIEAKLATIRQEERRAAFDESAESIVNEAGKVRQLMNLAAASARKEERATVKSMLEDYFKHFPCTCSGQPRTGGHFAVCPITIRDEVLGRIAGLEVAANETETKGEDGDDG